MKKLLLGCLGLVFSWYTAAAAPEDSLQILLAQREQLVKDYHYYNAQNSNFWGKKSKKDLLRIIETLKGIIRKDTDLINTVKTATLSKVADATVQKNRLEEQVKDDNVMVVDNLYELKTQIASLENLQKSGQRKINALQEEMAHIQNKKTNRDLIILLAGFMIAGLLGYIFMLRRTLNRAAD